MLYTNSADQNDGLSDIFRINRDYEADELNGPFEPRDGEPVGPPSPRFLTVAVILLIIYALTPRTGLYSLMKLAFSQLWMLGVELWPG